MKFKELYKVVRKDCFVNIYIDTIDNENLVVTNHFLVNMTAEDYRLLENREVLLIEPAKSEMIGSLLNIVVEKEIS
jgi:hypothetical protein